jgi:chromosome segregation ATPase
MYEQIAHRKELNMSQEVNRQLSLTSKIQALAEKVTDAYLQAQIQKLLKENLQKTYDALIKDQAKFNKDMEDFKSRHVNDKKPLESYKIFNELDEKLKQRVDQMIEIQKQIDKASEIYKETRKETGIFDKLSNTIHGGLAEGIAYRQATQEYMNNLDQLREAYNEKVQNFAGLTADQADLQKQIFELKTEKAAAISLFKADNDSRESMIQTMAEAKSNIQDISTEIDKAQNELKDKEAAVAKKLQKKLDRANNRWRRRVEFRAKVGIKNIPDPPKKPVISESQAQVFENLKNYIDKLQDDLLKEQSRNIGIETQVIEYDQKIQQIEKEFDEKCTSKNIVLEDLNEQVSIIGKEKDELKDSISDMSKNRKEKINQSIDEIIKTATKEADEFNKLHAAVHKDKDANLGK